MARYRIAGRSNVVGTASRGGVNLFASANVSFHIVEVHIYNTTTTAFEAALQRFTAATNVGTGLTEVPDDPDNPTASSTAFNGHTADGTTGSILMQAPIGAAIGSGVIWTFGDHGIMVPKGTTNGVGITCPTGTGQIFAYAIVFDE